MNYTSFNKNEEFFVDMQRCIGCKACEMACAECETNGRESLIHVNYVDRASTVQTTVQVCMHCDDPVCANVRPADAISKDENGIVHTANTERCIGCSNCVMACPFGVPKKEEAYDLMMKCTMCFDRTSVGKKPMCATVCPKRRPVLRNQGRNPGNASEQYTHQHLYLWKRSGQHQSQYHDAERKYGVGHLLVLSIEN